MHVEELLRQLTGPGFLELDGRRRHDEWHRLRELARKRIDRDDLAALAAADRVRGRLLLAGEAEACRRFALAELAIRAITRCQGAAWRPDGLHVDVDGLLDRPGDPLFESVDDRVLLRVPAAPGAVLPDDQVDVTTEATAGSIGLVLRGEGEDLELPLTWGPDALQFDDGGERLRFSVRLRIDPAELGSGRWQSYLRISSCGWNVIAPLDLGDVSLPAAVLPDRRFAAPIARPLGLTLSEALPPAALPTASGASGSTDVRVTRTGTHLRLVLDLALYAAGEAVSRRAPSRAPSQEPGREPGQEPGQEPDGIELPLALVPDSGAETDPVTSPGQLTCGAGDVGTLEAVVPQHRLLFPGRYALCVDGARLGLDLVLDDDGRARALATPAVSVVGAADRVHGEGMEWVGELAKARGEYVVFGIDDAEVSDTTLTALAHYGRQHGAEILQVRHPDATDPHDRPRTDLLTDLTLLDHGVPGTLYARRLLERAGIDPATDPPLLLDALAHTLAESTAVLGAATARVPARELARFPQRRERESGLTGPTFPIGRDSPVEPAQSLEPDQPSGPTGWADRAEPTGPTGPTGPPGPPGPPGPVGPVEPPGSVRSSARPTAVELDALEGAFASFVRRAAPGPRRDRVLQHWLGTQLLECVRADALAETGPAGRAALVAAVRRVLSMYCAGQKEALPPVPRTVARLVDDARTDALARLARWERDLHAIQDRPVELSFTDGAVLQVSAGVRLEGARAGDDPPTLLVPEAAEQDADGSGRAGAYPLLDGATARLLLYDPAAQQAGRTAHVGFTTHAAVHPQVTEAGPGAAPSPRFDLTASVDLGREAGRRLTAGVWLLRFRLDCLGVVRHLDPTARSADLPGGERRSRASARFGDDQLALAVGIDVDGSIELLRVPIPYVRTRGPLGRLVHRFTARRTHSRRNT